MSLFDGLEDSWMGDIVQSLLHFCGLLLITQKLCSLNINTVIIERAILSFPYLSLMP